MGISASVVAASDRDIERFRTDPEALDGFLHERIAHFDPRSLYLADYWDGLHFLLTNGGRQDRPPLNALRTGRIVYALDDPTHALTSYEVADLAERLAALDESTLRGRYDPARMSGQGGSPVYPGRYWQGEDGAQRSLIELLDYASRLRECVLAAVRRGEGLIFTRYEDW